jgi:lysozyme|nr:MAG TPA_asm: Lysozyme [Caudoviricetes sp.]
MYEKAIDLIKKYEGFSARPYKCPAGVLTIGYGRTINVKPYDITSEEAETVWLSKYVKTIADQILALVNVDLSNNQICALIDFVYNLGIGNFKSSTLLRKINQGDFSAAANELLRWNKAGGIVLKGLENRRIAERMLFLDIAE